MMDKGAIFSPDKLYRYRLWRYWDRRKGLVLFIGLNPLPSDDSATLRRCIGFATNWGYGGVLMGDIFAYRTADPPAKWKCDDPVGPSNDEALRSMNAEAKLTVLAWGNDGVYKGRGNQVSCKMFPNACSFGYTKQGQPRHPLYVPYNTLLVHNVIGW